MTEKEIQELNERLKRIEQAIMHIAKVVPQCAYLDDTVRRILYPEIAH